MVKRSLLLGALAILFTGSVIPVDGVSPVYGIDKIQHFLAYFLLTFLFYYNGLSLIPALLSSVSYGALIELTQYFIPYRDFSLGDIFTNSAGAFCFCLVRALVVRKKRNK